LAVCWLGVPFAGKSSPGVFGDSPESRVRQQIHDLRRHARWVVVVYHGGEEYTHIPQPARRNKLLRYLSYGADVVVAHHAHCVQRYERIGGKLVFYGLGNLVFDLDYHRNFTGTDESVLLSLTFSGNSINYTSLFTRQDRNRHLVLKAAANSNFSEITERSYTLEWGAEASRRLTAYWNRGHEGFPRNTWNQRAIYYWRKVRRVAGLVRICVCDRYGLVRPYYVDGAIHQLRNVLREKASRFTPT